MNNRRNLSDDLFDAALREALRQRAREEEQEAADLLDRFRDEAAAVTPSKKFTSNLKYLSSRAGKHKAPARIYPRYVRMAATIALVIGIGAAASAVAVQADWSSLFGWTLEKTPVATNIEKEGAVRNAFKDEIAGNTDWDYFYFPAYLPPNCHIEMLYADNDDVNITLADNLNKDKRIIFELVPIRDDLDVSFSIDTEGTRGLQKVVLGDRECYYVTKTRRDPDTNEKIRIVQIICNNGDYWITYISYHLAKKEAFKIFESLEKIEN